MKDNDPHALPQSGSKHKMPGDAGYIPHQNTRANLNDMAGKRSSGGGTMEKGYHSEEKIGSMGSDNMHIDKTNSGSY